MKRILTLLLALTMLFTLAACDDAPSGDDSRGNDGSGGQATAAVPTEKPQTEKPQNERPQTGAVEMQRSYRVGTRGGGADSVTLMIYLCGSDLESQGGAASLDLEEIMAADIGGNVNIVVETGGADYWENELIDPDTNERWLITDDGLEFLEDAGLKNMTSGDTLRDFIEFSAESFPADRYMLVLWDHGGGTVDGYASDERFNNNGMMSISELNAALAGAGVVFDMIGFDCCLMSTVETAFMVEKYADYMVASQRVEPGDGWHYTPWIQALCDDSSIPTDELGAVIVDSFIEESSSGYYGNELTLSVTDLTYIPALFGELYAFFETAQASLLEDGSFIETSKALGQSRAMSDNYDLVDLAYLVQSMEGSESVLSMLDLCVVYNGATIRDYYGLCLYFPYTDLTKVGYALDIFEQIGIGDEYQEFITAFANVMVGGQAYSGGGSGNPMGGTGWDEDYWLSLEWVDELLWGDLEGFFEDNSYDSDELYIYLKDDEYVLSMSDEDWDLITGIEQRVFLDDGEGYIDLGSDSMYEFDEDGDLLIIFDNTWICLDGELVCFYTLEEVFEDDGGWYTYGVVPVLYDGYDAEILIMWDDENPYGYVMGWRYVEYGSGSQRGLYELEDGMIFDILCDFYTYDGDYDDQYLWGYIEIDGEPEVSYEDVGDADCMVYYELYDIYRNTYWTESLIYGY